MENHREIECIREVLQGRTGRFAILVAEYQSGAYNLSFRMLGNTEDARDCTQEAFIKAYESLGAFRQDSRFSTWLYRIVYNLCISHLRKAGRIASLTGVSAGLDVGMTDNEGLESLGRDDMKMLLEAAYKALAPEEVFLVDMYYREDCTIEELGEMTGLSKSNVKIKLHRSRLKMHKAIQSIFKEEIEIWQTR
jgi:RNA polymerase sigma-70 factor (ECF subfamily)